MKELRSLRSKKYRYQLQKYIAEGEKIVEEIIEQLPASLLHVVCTEAYRRTLPFEVIQKLGHRLLDCDQGTLDSISALTAPTPVIAVMKMPPVEQAKQLDAKLGLYLDGIRDPGNLGTILRIADWFGAQVFLSNDCVDIYNPKTIQASMGAFLRTVSITATLDEIRAANPKLQAIGTAIDSGEDALAFEWPEQALLIIGSESHGIRVRKEGLIDRTISIPRGTGYIGSESLNAAVATGILCSSHLSYFRNRSV